MPWVKVEIRWVPKGLRWHAVSLPGEMKTMCGIKIFPELMAVSKPEAPKERRCKRCLDQAIWQAQINAQHFVDDGEKEERS